MSDDSRKRWLELAQQDRVAESSRFVRDLYWWDVARYVLNQNYRDAVEIPDVIEWNSDFVAKATREQEQIVHLEFVRRFHNYVAAAKTVVDNTRTLRKRWSTEELDRLFEDRLKQVQELSVVHFVHGLRNEMHHSQLPRIHRVIAFDSVAPGPNTVITRTRLMVDTASLLALREWSVGARAYIGDSADGDRVDMTLTVRRYHEGVGAFQEWFSEGIQMTRKDLLDDFDARRSEMARLSRT